MPLLVVIGVKDIVECILVVYLFNKVCYKGAHELFLDKEHFGGQAAVFRLLTWGIQSHLC